MSFGYSSSYIGQTTSTYLSNDSVLYRPFDTKFNALSQKISEMKHGESCKPNLPSM
jgi:hypothetical protein